MDVDIVIPVLDEEEVLERNVRALCAFLSANCTWRWRVTIFSNGSTDGTARIGRELARRLPGVAFRHTDRRGKARAIRSGWESSDADVLGFMDADLATDLAALPECLARIEAGADLAIGNRHAPESRVSRSLLRGALSRGYAAAIRAFFPFTAIRDAPCGFKFVRARVARRLLARIRNESWFFDSELVLLAERAGDRIAQVPVRWTEGAKSKVRFQAVVWEYLSNLARLRWRAWRRFATEPPGR